jgi:hypothetical protein
MSIPPLLKVNTTRNHDPTKEEKENDNLEAKTFHRCT